MAAIDLIILAVLALYLGKGVWRGALPELCSACGLAVGLFLASRFAPDLGAELGRVVPVSGEAGRSFLFVVLMLIAVCAFALLGFLVGRLPLLANPGGGSRVAGGFLALAQGVVVLALVLHALTAHPWPRSLGPVLQRGTLAPPFVQLGTAVYRGGDVMAAGSR